MRIFRDHKLLTGIIMGFVFSFGLVAVADTASNAWNIGDGWLWFASEGGQVRGSVKMPLNGPNIANKDYVESYVASALAGFDGTAGVNINDFDCAGILNGEAYLDNCGVCVGGFTHLEECVADDCGVIGGDGSTCDDCSDFDNRISCMHSDIGANESWCFWCGDGLDGNCLNSELECTDNGVFVCELEGACCCDPFNSTDSPSCEMESICNNCVNPEQCNF